MTIAEHISSLAPDRRAFVTELHETITANDPGVVAVIKPMMGKEMILYEQTCTMKYGLASAKDYLSLHCLPMYMDPAIHAKYLQLAPAAKFQKGCINFTGSQQLPVEIVTALIAECAAVNIAEVLANRKKKK
jgi:hypothetical protein